MKRIIFTAILVFAFCFAALAQAGDCSEITVVTPDKVLIPDKPEVVSVTLDAKTAKTGLVYEWTVSAGKILKGQGTSEIEFVVTEESATNIDVAVKISGLPKDCPNTASDIMPVMQPPIGEPVETIGRHKSTKEGISDYLFAINRLLVAVSGDQNSEGLITIGFEKKDSRNYKISLLKKIHKFLVSIKFDLTRITFAISDGDFDEKTVLWVVPLSAKFPKYVEKDHTMIKAEELKQKIKKLFPKK